MTTPNERDDDRTTDESVVEDQEEALLEDSETRHDRDQAPGTHLEHRTSDEATPPT